MIEATAILKKEALIHRKMKSRATRNTKSPPIKAKASKKLLVFLE